MAKTSLHDAFIQALDEVQVIALQPLEFNGLLAQNLRFSSLLIRKLAQSVQTSADKARDLSFLDVQQRLRRSLTHRTGLIAAGSPGCSSAPEGFVPSQGQRLVVLA